MLLNTIKKDQVVARKNRDSVKASLLTTLYSEASLVGKNKGNRESTDEEVIAVIKKFIGNAQEILKYRDDEKANQEIQILNSYLPRQLTTDELEWIIQTYKKDNPDAKIGQIMSWLKENYSGKYDAKEASRLAK